MPPGTGELNGTYCGPLPYLLPYLEQGAIYNQIPTAFFQFNSAGTANGDGVWYGAAWTAANNRVKSFECPADDLTVTVSSGEWAYIYYSGYSISGGYFSGNYPTLGCSNYIGCAGSLGDVSASGDSFYGQWTGVYADGYGIRLVNITDGTSNTIGFGETIGGSDTGTRDFKFPWMAASAQCLAWGLPTPTEWHCFGSKHTGVVNFSFCDGSVRGINKGVGTSFFTSDWYALQEVGGYKDGDTINYNLLGQ